jgi:hypothetical protein
MLKLPQVTLVAMTSVHIDATLRALEYSSLGVDFGETIFLTHEKPKDIGKIKHIEIAPITNINEFSYRVIYELPRYIETEYALIIHADGFVVNPASWSDDFLKYDYIGAPWPIVANNYSFRNIDGVIQRVGNGLSLRSKRLLDLPIKLNLPWQPHFGSFNEDIWICCKNSHIYKSYGMEFAPLEVAKYFSHETMIPEVMGIKPFVFHKWAGQNSIYPKFY